MNIVVDIREQSLIEKLQNLPLTQPNVRITTEQLLIGDVLLKTDDGKEVVLFERKSLSDLLASIKDGRYKEQSHRLIHTSGIQPHNIIYVIEGVLSTLRSPLEKKMVLSSIASLSYFKGFSVFRTSTVVETAEIVMAMASKIQKEFSVKGSDPEPIGEASSSRPEKENPKEEQVSYSSFVKKNKRDNITPENIGEILLCQIPGISSTIAAEVLRHFGGSFLNLIEELKTSPEKLDGIYLDSSGGKKRKLSSSVVSAIKTFLSPSITLEPTF